MTPATRAAKVAGAAILALAALVLGAVLYAAYLAAVLTVRAYLLLAHGGYAMARGAGRILAAMVAWYLRVTG